MRALLSGFFWVGMFPFLSFAQCTGVGCSCSISALTTVNFSNYNPFYATAVDGTGSISVTCTTILLAVVSYTVDLSVGSSGGVAIRRMVNGSNTINYNLYSDAARTQIWGNGTSGTSRISANYTLIVNGTRTDPYPIYGRVPASQNVAVGTYTDTITVTVTF